MFMYQFRNKAVPLTFSGKFERIFNGHQQIEI